MCVYVCLRYVLVRGCQVVSYIWHKRVVFDLSCCYLIHVYVGYCIHTFHVCMATQLCIHSWSWVLLKSMCVTK